jgi:hypothetical protein
MSYQSAPRIEIAKKVVFLGEFGPIRRRLVTLFGIIDAVP